MTTPSITRQLVLRLSLGLLLTWSAAAAGAVLLIRHEVHEVLDDNLEATARSLLPLARAAAAPDARREHWQPDGLTDEDSDGKDREEGEAGEDSEDGHHRDRHPDGRDGDPRYLAFRLSDEAGRLLIASGRGAEAGFAAPQVPGFANVGDRRVFTLRAEGGGAVVQVAEDLSHRNGAVWGAGAWLVVPMLAVLAFGALFAALTVRTGLLPLTRLRQQIARRDAGALAALDTAGMPVELRSVADEINHLLMRLRAALAAERAFSADAAHALRTPLATALAHVQRLRIETAGTPAATRATETEAALRRLEQLAAKLLQLARAEAGIARAERAIDLLPAVALIIAEHARMAGGRSVTLVEPVPESLLAPMDVDAFAIAFDNIVENAVRHGESDQPVSIIILTPDRILVRNAVPALPQARLAELTRRFARGPTRAPGSGLGLAIAAQLLEQAGGRLTLRSPIPGQADGFEAEMQLPAAGTIE